ncbi:MAG: succinylglutamate desuccinylase/aspartoacylase family protein [Alphaproteobacteria bacterium]|nr:succinylglutamate desuccinylase/aspartoacylase family protein [Alphaproteobacteria bacterium]
MLVPVVVARGARPGPVLGLTAVVHGNELNGIPVIHRLLQELDLSRLAGAVAAVPVVNVPGYHRNERRFNDGADLNRTFPGREGGTNAEVFSWRFLDRAVRHFDYLVDLHTASFGRTNSLYIRADLRDATTRGMAEAFHPQLLLHNRSEDGTLRDAALDLGVPAITVEIGNPQRIQEDLVRHSVGGLQRILALLGLVDHTPPAPPPTPPIRCGRSYWLYTDRGGVLEVFPPLLASLDAGAHIAQVRDIYGVVTRDFHAPEAGVVIGRSTNPVNQTGSRILHLGIEGDPETAPAAPDA